MGKEYEAGLALAEAAKEAGVQVIVWSSLPNVNEITAGKWVSSLHIVVRRESRDFYLIWPRI